MQNDMQISKPSSNLKIGLTMNNNSSVVIIETNIIAVRWQKYKALIRKEKEIVLKKR